MAHSMAQGGQFSHIQLDPSVRTVVRRIRNLYDATRMRCAKQVLGGTGTFMRRLRRACRAVGASPLSTEQV
jgi:hypothetical protein